jgi:hypothetical protein
MIKTKLLAYLMIFFAISQCNSQQEDYTNQVVKDLGKRILKTEFSSLLFLENELVKSCVDTVTRSNFIKYLRSYGSFKRKAVDDQREYQLSLHLLYHKIFAIKPQEGELIESRKFLLKLLENYKSIDFEVSDKLILSQMDGTKRSMINNYDEGVLKESWLIFFNYDPILFKSVLLANGKEKSWQKANLILCNAFRENSIPTSIRYQLKRNTISFLAYYKNKDVEIEALIGKLSECDVSVDLND